MRRKYSIWGASFLIFLGFLLLQSCGKSGVPAGDILDQEEIFLVEEYLKLIEARKLALNSIELSDSAFAALGDTFPLDSLRGIARQISEDNTERWIPIYEEIHRRGQLGGNP
ncbi:MAG: hypothetical protein QF492_03765 [Candidatus Krumholzibacteria bacterium]|nr:hypothetical protein [Candidatus Krumholzibacteria bacterium]MDP6669014.1 hypothetical protein [Candidatus Krumholzibacteria bacterium]MDP7021732.1 hypothetical protein [Candidatus Krumholzibacteria bacterium]